MSLHRKRSKISPASDLNLIPIMNLVLVLIPAVLYQTQLVKVGRVDIETPRMTQCCAYKTENPPQLTVALDQKNGFILKTSRVKIGHILSSKPTSSLPILIQSPALPTQESYTIPKKDDGSFDYPTLYQIALQIKKHHPNAHSLVLTGHAQIEFKHFIHTLDTIRYIKPHDLKIFSFSNRSLWIAPQFARYLSS